MVTKIVKIVLTKRIVERIDNGETLEIFKDEKDNSFVLHFPEDQRPKTEETHTWGILPEIEPTTN